jgi:hypothetical protein
LHDLELQKYAQKIQKALQVYLETETEDSSVVDDDWISFRQSVIADVLNDERSVAAIQGTLRMSGLFAQKDDDSHHRFISLDDAPDPTSMASSMSVYTMFPQMPDPMPLPSSTPEELKEELFTREARVAESGRDPHKDKYGRIFTHKSTANVSNTTHGI